MNEAMTPVSCLAIIAAILLVGFVLWLVDLWLNPPVPDRLETRRRRPTPWYR